MIKTKDIFEIEYDMTKTTASHLIHVIGNAEGIIKVKMIPERLRPKNCGGCIHL